MSNTDAAMSVNCNVTIRCIDRHGKIIQEVNKHNKASFTMVEGLLKFLGGDFNNTILKEGTPSFPDEALPYIPVRAQFGCVGVKRTKSEEGRPPFFNNLDTSEFVVPTFTSSSLQEPVDHPVLNFSKIRQTVFIDPNNSQCLKMSLYINPGSLVGHTESVGEEFKFTPYDWSYWNPSKNQYEAMFTEVGLFSSTGNLLARVLFDGEVTSENFYDSEGKRVGTYPVFVKPSSQMNPIVQSQSSTIVVEWRIGLVSVGDNDELITQNNLSTTQFATRFTEWFVDEIVPKVKSDELTNSEIKVVVTEKVIEEVGSLLGNNNIDVVEVKESNS